MTVKTEQEYIAEQINDRLAGGTIKNACMDDLVTTKVLRL